MTQVVTELVVDARGAEQGSANYIRAMRAAQAELDKLADAEHKAAIARDKTTASMLGQSASITKVRGDWEKLRASTDPVFAAQAKAQKEIERATLLADNAVKRGVTTQLDATRVVDALRAKHDGLIRSVQGTSKATEFASLQAQSFASRAGVMGEALGYLGPAGIAAAAGLGVAAIAIKTLHDEATKFSADAVKLREFSNTVGLASVELQALNDLGAKFAISEDKMGISLQRFSVQMEEFKDGQGKLFEIVQKVDPALARQMATAKSTAEQLDLLSKAYLRAGDSQNALSKSAFGKSGFDIGRVVADINAQGGMATLTAEFTKSGDALNKGLIDRVATLRTEIDDMAEDARKNVASIFSESVLEKERTYVSAWLELSRVAKNFELSDDAKSFLSAGAKGFVGSIPGIGPLLIAADTAANTLGKKRPSASSTPEGPPPPPGMPQNPAWAEPQDIPVLTPTAQMNLERVRISALGTAANLTEQYNLKQLELNATLNAGRINQETYNRALGAARIDLTTSLLTQRISALGEDASVTDIVTAKKLALNKAVQQGVALSKDEIASILEKTRLLAENSRLENQLQFDRSQLGRTPIEQTVASQLRGAGLSEDSARGQAIADQVRLNEQIKIGKDLMTDFATGAVGEFRSQLKNGVNEWNAFAAAGMNALSRLGDKLIDMAMQNLVAKAFGGALGMLGGGMGGGGSMAFMGASGSNPWMSNASWGAVSANGNVFNAGSVIPFAKGDIFTSPVMFPMSGGRKGLAGEAGPEAIMPLRRGSDGKLGVSGAGGGMTVNIGDDKRVINIGQGASAETVQQLKAELDRDRRDRKAHIINTVREAKRSRQLI